MLCWSKNVVAECISIFKNLIAFKVSNESGISYNIAFVYGSPKVESRKHVWDSIFDVMNMLEGGWMLIGDFNQLKTTPKR